MSSSNCCFLTCIQVSQEAGQVVWYFHLFQNFPQFIVIHTVKGFDIVNKAEVDVFLELSYVSDDPADVDSLVSGSSAFSKSSLNIWKFMVHVSLKPDLENFEHYFSSVWDECNHVVVWASLALPFFGIGMKTDLQLRDFWRLSVDNSQSLKLQGNQATGGFPQWYEIDLQGLDIYPLCGSQQTVEKS